MKDQYFGDVNDYIKYGLIRFLARELQLSVTLCWMLTAPDARGDGGKVRYLEHPDRWSHLDPELFCSLRRMLSAAGTDRSVILLEGSDLLQQTTFFSEVLTADPASRRTYFNKLWAFAAETDVVLFDPDNGMEVRSVPRGRAGSPKYLYWDEAREAYGRGHSLVIFQHFPRADNGRFARDLAAKSASEIPSPEVVVLRSPNVAFLFVPQPRHAAAATVLVTRPPMSLVASRVEAASLLQR